MSNRSDRASFFSAAHVFTWTRSGSAMKDALIEALQLKPASKPRIDRPVNRVYVFVRPTFLTPACLIPDSGRVGIWSAAEGDHWS